MAIFPFFQLDPSNSPTFNKHFSRPIVARLDGPIELFWDDVWNLLAKSPLLPYVLRPFWTNTPTDELYLYPPSGPVVVWWTVVSIIQVPIFLALIASCVFVVSLCQALLKLDDIFFWNGIQGPDMQVYPAELPPEKSYNPRHRWIFLNGIAVAGEGLHQNLEVLSKTFNAPVLGIHNRTYGFLGDLGECVIQRAFGYRTLDTRITIPIIKRYLEQSRDEVERVILVAHSQGGICASHVLEQLFAEVSWDLIADRLEVYTFGSAARFFPNPWRDASKTERLVRHMEHYCHEDDIICSFGALASMRRIDNPFRGKCFVWKDEPGHLLNQHYLKGMFTGPEETWDEDNFQRGSLSPYPGPERNRWYVVPGEKDTAAGATVKDVSNLWKYMEGPEGPPTTNGHTTANGIIKHR